MTSAPTPYIIQFINNGTPVNYCLGVQQAIQNAPVVLSLLSGGNPTTQWYMDPTSGLITNAASTPGNSMYLSIQGNSPVNGTPIILSPFTPGNVFQQWNWFGGSQRIYSVGAASMCVDNNGCALTPGNKIQLYSQTGACQQFQFLPVPAFEAFIASGGQDPAKPSEPRLRV